MSPRALAASVMILALAARAEPEPRHFSPPTDRVWHALLIGATGLALAGGYAAGAVATGDRPSAQPLALTGGVLTGGLTGLSLGLAFGAVRDDPGSMAAYLLRPVIGGVVGAIVGGVLAGFGAWKPGTLRTVTHVVIVGFIIGDTVLVELARLVR